MRNRGADYMRRPIIAVRNSLSFNTSASSPIRTKKFPNAEKSLMYSLYSRLKNLVYFILGMRRPGLSLNDLRSKSLFSFGQAFLCRLAEEAKEKVVSNPDSRLASQLGRPKS